MSRFPTTVWKLIDAVSGWGDSKVSEADMNRFITAYWKPVFRYLRMRGYPVEAAEDLTQGFFLSILEKRWVKQADATRGRFRTFLLTVLKRFVADQGPNRARRQVRFENQMVPVAALMTDEDRSFEPSSTLTPDHVFMHAWAQAVIATTCRRLRLWCEDQGRPDWYALFEATNLPSGESRKLSQRAAADRFHISRDQVRYGLELSGESFVRFLREELAGQVETECELDEEVCELEKYLQL